MITVSHQRITDLTPKEWEGANEWFCSECEAFADTDVEWTMDVSVLVGECSHHGIAYRNDDGKYSADFADDGGNVKLDANLPFAEMVKVAEAARFSAAQDCAACVLESKYGGDDLYGWQWDEFQHLDKHEWSLVVLTPPPNAVLSEKERALYCLRSEWGALE